MKISYLSFVLVAIVIVGVMGGCICSQNPGTGGGTAPGGTASSAATIEGSTDQVKTVELPAGGYLFTYRYSGNLSLDIDDAATGDTYYLISAAAKGGKEEVSTTIFNVSAPAGGTVFNVTADAPYTISISPLSAPRGTASPPTTFSDKGTRIVGPVQLNAGKATFETKSSDFNIGSFYAVLKDAKTAKRIDLVASSVSVSGGGMYTITTRVNEKDTLDIPATGPYYIEVHVEPNDNPWTITVTQ